MMSRRETNTQRIYIPIRVPVTPKPDAMEMWRDVERKLKLYEQECKDYEDSQLPYLPGRPRQ